MRTGRDASRSPARFGRTVGDMRQLLFTTAAALAALLAFAPPAWAAWVWPLPGEVITPYRNGDDPYAGGQHRGIDIAGRVGEQVVAAAGGEVGFAGVAGSSGLTVRAWTPPTCTTPLSPY